jgi:hypothetical protein
MCTDAVLSAHLFVLIQYIEKGISALLNEFLYHIPLLSDIYRDKNEIILSEMLVQVFQRR